MRVAGTVAGIKSYLAECRSPDEYSISAMIASKLLFKEILGYATVPSFVSVQTIGLAPEKFDYRYSNVAIPDSVAQSTWIQLADQQADQLEIEVTSQVLYNALEFGYAAHDAPYPGMSEYDRFLYAVGSRGVLYGSFNNQEIRCLSFRADIKKEDWDQALVQLSFVSDQILEAFCNGLLTAYDLSNLTGDDIQALRRIADGRVVEHRLDTQDDKALETEKVLSRARAALGCPTNYNLFYRLGTRSMLS